MTIDKGGIIITPEMKITLVLSASKRYREAVEKGIRFRSYAPTTLIQLAALVPPELEAEVKIFDLMGAPLPENIDADIIGISTITAGAPEAYRIAAMAKKKGITVVIGGSHATLLPQEALQHADAVVVGYAEKTWPQLLRDFKNNQLKPMYKDFSSPFSIPMPPLNRRMLPRKHYLFTNTLEATRGCPNNCEFCVLKDITSNCHWTRNIKDVREEIETMGKQILFLDSSPTEFKDYMKKLWKELIPLRIKWYGASTFRFTQDEEAIKLAAQSGCKGLLIGFESLNQGALDGINKAFNNAARFREGIKRLHDHGIAILGCFVFGFDEDDPSIFDKTVEFSDAAKIDIVKYAVLTPLPGTPIFNKLKKENRILTEDWNLYDTEHVVYRPKQMSPQELEEGCKRAFYETYKYSSIIKRIMRKGSPWFYSILGNIGFRRVGYTYYHSQ
ncbi:MAG: B12-binding domain-containing radical SAM protein [Candidatus Aminicenantes bacterium]|nr:MAG: B12-binding domain-containing radical SAM protein [Candidatus Aminicenantes bacterium]